MRPAARSSLFRYGFAVVAVGAAILIRLLLSPLLHDYAPYATFVIAVAAVAWYGDFGPSLLATVLSYLAAHLFFKPPVQDHSLDVALLGQQLTLGPFPFVGFAIALCSGAIHAAKRRRRRPAPRRPMSDGRTWSGEVAERKRLQDELQRQAEELAAADRRKDEFLAMLAHELRNPLAPIRNAAQLLSYPGGDRCPVPAGGRGDRPSGVPLARLVDDLLDVSRISRGKVKLRKERGGAGGGRAAGGGGQPPAPRRPAAMT